MSPVVVNLPRCLQSGQRSWLGRSPTWWIPLVPGGPLLHTPAWHCRHSESKSTHRHQYQTSDLMHMLPEKAKKFSWANLGDECRSKCFTSKFPCTCIGEKYNFATSNKKKMVCYT